jgi:4'-phosphopantetheinyl transferase
MGLALTLLKSQGDQVSVTADPLPNSFWERSVERNAPRSLFVLPQDAIHVWCTSLDPCSTTSFDFERSLSDDEVERAGRFRFSKDRQRFVVGRGFLRRLLGCYLGCEPSMIKFVYGEFGKPSLARQSSLEPILFNLSHSGSQAVFAFARGREVGVDVERIDPGIDVTQVAGHLFTPGEFADVVARPGNQRYARFFDLWTRKEALIKAQGKGMSTNVRELDVSVFDHSSNDFPAGRYGHPLGCWSVWQFTPALGYVAALAANGVGVNLRIIW